MVRRHLGASQLVVLATVLIVCVCICACTSALKEPPPVADLAAGHAAPVTSDESLAGLVDAAAAAFAGKPEVTAVEHARELYLQATAVEEAPVEAYLGAARTTAWLVEHIGDRARRKLLATEGVQVGQWCRRRFPSEPACRYHLALAVGQQARERPSTATDGLDVMVNLLDELIEEAPELDAAGPYRVLALVLLRAPGWPSGPGDPESGLEHARAAAAAFPRYPPNQLVLGEALLANQQVWEGRRALETVITLTEPLAATGDTEAAEWLAEARATLADSR
jgi:hypothetical protein